MPEIKPITLTLAPWQQRMCKDHMRTLRKVEFTKLIISNIPRKEWVMYRVPTPFAQKAGAFNLYLDDKQIDRVKAALGADVELSALNVTPALVKSGAITFQ